MQQSLKEKAGDYCAEIVCYSTQMVAFDSLFIVRRSCLASFASYLVIFTL